ncbi:MAG: sulfatase [Phenylobacterium sp. SCN 70-31]|nr:MAG: sulfatase [Phenylobacterium sp. SCN 70-31]
MIHRRKLLLSLLGSSALGSSAMAGSAPRRPMGTRPNIVAIVLDDLGFSDLGCFGGEIRTPNIDRLAARGLRYNRFDTKAVCSPTRASLMTGRNAHTVRMPDVPDVLSVPGGGPYPEGTFHIPAEAQNLAQALRGAGYANWLVGKWHLVPMDQLDDPAKGDAWPLQRGFDRFYGFARGWTDQYRPALVEDDRYISPDLPADYHLSADLVSRSTDMIRGHRASRPEQPFFLYLGLGVAHSPIQVPARYADAYAGTYEKGWDAMRAERFERMKRMGVIPADTNLPQREAGDRAWADLSDDERVVFARHMALYAGFVQHADEQIGRLFETLEATGQAENTIVVLLSDNGPASEAGQAGVFDGLYRPNTLPPSEQRARLAELGAPGNQSQYPRPWAFAGSTPFQRYKLWPHLGGVRAPLIVSWPAVIRDGGAVRSQALDVIDVAPTLLEAAGTAFAGEAGGRTQTPVAGRSFSASFTDPRAPDPRDTQYFELRGSRAIRSGRWRAVATHPCGQPFEDDRWALYDLETDFSESRDVSARHPDVLARLKRLWQEEWSRYSPHPLTQPPARICESLAHYDSH